MENKLKEICICLHNIAQLENDIAQNKLSPNEVKALLQLVDVKAKGFLDLTDIYELVGKVNENELFAIFKFLDTQRTGEIRLQQLQQCLANPKSASNNTTKQYIFPRFYTIIDTIKDRPKLIAQAKDKLGLNAAQLKSTYNYICSLVQSKYITTAELITVMKAQAIKYGLKWGTEHEKVIAQLMPGQNVSESKFIECFSCEPKKIKQECEEQNLLSDIQGYSSKNSPRKEQPPVVTKTAPPVAKPKVDNEANTSIIYKKTNNFFEKEPVEAPSFRNNNFSTPKSPPNEPSPYRKQFDQIQGNINGVLDAIQQRRERLRQDSLDRKRLIEDVLNRKRQLCGLSNSKIPSKQSNWRSDQLNSTFINSLKSNSKAYPSSNYNSSSPKQFSYPQYNRNSPPLQNQLASESYSPLNTTSKISQPLSRDYQMMITPDYKFKSRPQTPTASSSYKDTDINQILKRYNQNRPQQYKRPEQDSNTLKQLCKSKSGCFYPQSPSNYSSYCSKYSEVVENHELRYGSNDEGTFNAKARGASKQNVMKRAEEEAARKIEEIQRKARMKVLQKKGIMGRTEKDTKQWRPLTKKGVYY